MGCNKIDSLSHPQIMPRSSSAVSPTSISSIADSLTTLPEKAKEGYTLREAIAALAEPIRTALERGYSHADIAVILHDHGIPISPGSLKSYLPQKGQPKRRTRRPRKTETLPAIEAVSEVVSTPEPTPAPVEEAPKRRGRQPGTKTAAKTPAKTATKTAAKAEAETLPVIEAIIEAVSTPEPIPAPTEEAAPKKRRGRQPGTKTAAKTTTETAAKPSTKASTKTAAKAKAAPRTTTGKGRGRKKQS